MRVTYNWILERSVLLFCLLVFMQMTYAQGTASITGKVVNKFTEEPLPFATVYWKAADFGVMTDSAGSFTIKKSFRPADTLVVRYVGYVPKHIPLQHAMAADLVIPLEATVNIGVEVKAKLDRGLVWWRQIVAHKQANEPGHYESYYADLYNKLEIDIANINRKRFEHSRILKPYSFITRQMDTTSEQTPFLPVFLSESVSDYYIAGAPPKVREEIRALNTSGIKNESVMEYLGGINQKVNTYNNYMYIFGREFVSPVSSTGDRYYNYKGLDTITRNGQEYYHLAFTPKREGENLFAGDCWIQSNTWALQKISLSISKVVSINFVKRLDIIQEFNQLNEREWVVTKDKCIVELSPLGKEKTSFIGRKTTLYRNIAVNQQHINGRLGANRRKEEVVIADSAVVNGKRYMEQHRPESLTANELRAITLIDTLKSMPEFRRLSNTVTFLVDGHIKLGKVEIGPWYKWISRNRVEGMRFRFDLGTTPQFNRNLRLFGYLAYGMKDKSLKGKMAVSYSLPGDNGWSIFSSYKNDLDNNQRGFNGEEVSLDNIFGQVVRRHGIPQKFIREDEVKLSVLKQFPQQYSLQGTVSRNVYNTFDPLPSHKMFFPEGAHNSHIVNTEFQLKFRYAPGEREIKTFRKVRRLRSDLPVTELSWSFAPSGVLDSKYNYQKLSLNVNQQFQIPRWGRVNYMVYAGKIFADKLPFMLLQVHPGNETYYYNKEAFSLMNKYEFFSDEYVGVNIEHNFNGKLLNLLPFMRKTGVRQFWNVKTVTGNLSYKNRVFNNMEFGSYGMRSLRGNVYTEVGTGFDNIFKYFRIDAVWRIYPKKTPMGHTGNFGLFGSFRLQF
ncbi:Carboxypeptidase-like protein [Chitinophaga sp. 180180018-2]|nr:Carboxypeptidase-like protein [Chitinophaga sp. 212800010-3]